jgi:hypothetical protein
LLNKIKINAIIHHKDRINGDINEKRETHQAGHGKKKMSKRIIADYLKAIHEMFSSGDAREESYYTILESLIEKMWKINFPHDPRIIIIPKRTEAGNPDFVIKDDKSRIAGYIEAKAPLKNLDEAENSKQLRRYREVFPNLLLTNFLEFRWYRDGKYLKSFSLATPDSLRDAVPPSFTGSPGRFREFFKDYLDSTDLYYLDYKRVAEELARQTRFMRDVVVLPELRKNVAEDIEISGYTRHIHGLLADFRTYLIHGLSIQEFADLYAQTFTFGIFTAAASHEEVCDLRLIGRLIPPTNGILREIFQIIEMGIVPPQLECCLNYILDIINRARAKRADGGDYINNAFNGYVSTAKGRTVHPLIHFYETFLSNYDPRLREKKGVYYTPEPVVEFIAQSIHIILKEKLNKPDGLAEPTVKILDPAAGTGTFPAIVTHIVLEEYVQKYGEGAKAVMSRDYLLKNLFAFEGMMAPYAVGHWRMVRKLQKEGIQLTRENHFNLLITNTMEIGNIEQPAFHGMSYLSEESRKADKVKIQTPITVVLGNPPYAGHSTNPSKTAAGSRSTWIGQLIEDYKKINGQSLGEKNPKWLQDDYVKFIRFAQYKIDTNGKDEGVVGFVTNHAYLDNPTFRGMRKSLMNSFDEIYILDLHGNALKKEKCPDGSPDENIFDIRQGVAISLFIKTIGIHTGCRVFHADLWGSRESKYNILGECDIRTIQWQEVFPGPEFYLFTPTHGMDFQHYQSFTKITDIFPVHSVGIVTARDKLTIRESKQEMWSRVMDFAHADEAGARHRYHLGADTRDWQVKQAQQDLWDSGPDQTRIVPILYRPFDRRFTYYTGKSRGFLCMPRADVMQHMLKENTGLVTVRQVAEGQFNHCLIYLYLFPSSKKSHSRHPNINPGLLKRLGELPGFSPPPAPEHILYYIYAVLFSNRYRETYAEGLKIDFPRIPFTSSRQHFDSMVDLGEKLAAVHLMKPGELNHTLARFEVSGDNTVKRIYYDPPGEQVFINPTQYFSAVPHEVWEYRLAGYRVMQKWLTLRKGRALETTEIVHFIKMARALQLTVQYQSEIDALYPHIEETTLPF